MRLFLKTDAKFEPHFRKSLHEEFPSSSPAQSILHFDDVTISFALFLFDPLGTRAGVDRKTWTGTRNENRFGHG